MKLIQILKEIKATPPTDWNRIEEIIIDDLEGWVYDIFETDFEDIEDFVIDDLEVKTTPMFAYTPIDNEGIMDVYSTIIMEDKTNTHPSFPREYLLTHSFDPNTYEIIDVDVDDIDNLPSDIIYLKDLD